MFISVEMALQQDALERRASAQAQVCNRLELTGNTLEFCPKEQIGLVSGRIRHWIKREFGWLTMNNEKCKFKHDFDVELHGTDDDRKLMARMKARCAASGIVGILSSWIKRPGWPTYQT